MLRTERFFRGIGPRQDRSVGRRTRWREAGTTGIGGDDEGPPWMGRSSFFAV